ncbi:MAG: hypothetical protein H7A25_15355 [Leptospiraceae bacterium]|nr:hypothetical protein [Leptospiraceae bacterium]MCP5501276.1 hypothetical protein [Leptospiraceae bacterium]
MKQRKYKLKLNARAFIILFLLLSSVSLFAREFVYVSSPSAKLMKEPKIVTDSYFPIKKAEKLEIIQKEGVFFKVRYKGKVGYVPRMFTHTQKPPLSYYELDPEGYRYCSSEKRSEEFNASYEPQKKVSENKPDTPIIPFYEKLLGIGIYSDMGLNLKPANKFLQFNLFSGNSAGVYGFNSGIYKNLVDGDMAGLQFGFWNSVNQSVYGVQAGGFNDSGKGGYGLQFGFIGNMITNDFWGMQIGTLNNWNKSDTLAQISLFNNTARGAILQTSILKNSSEGSFVQFAFFYNIAKRENFILQTGLFNRADKSKIQLGFFNYAERKASFQIGIFNIGDNQYSFAVRDDDSFFQMGVYNYARKNVFLQLGLINHSSRSSIPYLPFIRMNLEVLFSKEKNP